MLLLLCFPFKAQGSYSFSNTMLCPTSLGAFAPLGSPLGPSSTSHSTLQKPASLRPCSCAAASPHLLAPQPTVFLPCALPLPCTYIYYHTTHTSFSKFFNLFDSKTACLYHVSCCFKIHGNMVTSSRSELCLTSSIHWGACLSVPGLLT